MRGKVREDRVVVGAKRGMTRGRGGMVESGVSLRTNVKQSRKVGNGLLRR